MDKADLFGMSNCRICPRECGADRTSVRRGVCGMGADITVARAALHAWEEPVISGKNGSGAVFFSGCSLGCVYCQNAEISRAGTATGRIVTSERLAEIFLQLQDQEKANNINLVTATHYIPQIAEAIRIARDSGLRIPVIYNTSGYEKVSSLQMLEGLVDVYLPDLKYVTPDLAKRYSRADDYPDRAKDALQEMVRQTGTAQFAPEPGNETNPLIIRGVIVRHLLLPGHVEEAKKVVSYLRKTYGDQIWISLMNQYTPMPAMREDPLLFRKVTKREYEKLTDYAIEIGVEHGFIQEGKTAKESFIPAWNGEGV